MNNEIKIFEKEEFGQIRVAGTTDEPLFCLADLCKAVELSNPSSVKQRLDPEDVQLIDFHALNPTEGTNYGNSMANFVTESGFYDVILQSCSKKVKLFRKWITSEVLPSIRKTGGYMAVTPEMSDIEIMSRALLIAQTTIDRKNALIEQQQKEIEHQANAIAARKEIIKTQHETILNKTSENIALKRQNMKLVSEAKENEGKIRYYDQCTEMADDTLLSFRETAAMLNIPERQFIEALLDANIIYRSKGKLTPYSKYLDKGFFRLVEWVNQTNGYYYQTKITVKGREYLNSNWERIVVVRFKRK